jgi:hypothetical protein
VNQNKKVTFKFSQRAFGFGDNKLPKEEDLGTFTSTFNELKLEKPEILEFGTRLYEEVKDCPDMNQIKKYHRLYTRGVGDKKAYNIIETQARKTKAAIDSLAEVYEFYHQKGVEPKFDENLNKVQGLLNKIRDWKDAVHSDPTSTTISDLVVELEFLEVPEPRFHFERPGYAGSWGNGDPWEDIDPNMVMQCVYPRSIPVRAANVIDRLMTVYCFKDGRRDDFSREHGGNGGTLLEKFTLTPNERVHFVGSWDSQDGARWLVKRFEIYTQANHIFFGNEGGNWHDQGRGDHNNWAFVGWSGRSNVLLDYLRAVYVAFEKPYWRMPVMLDSGR